MEFEEIAEVWSSGEEDGLLNDLEVDDEAPNTDSIVSPEEVESRALAKWVIIFLMFIQATHKLSNAVIQVFLRFFQVIFTVIGSNSSLTLNVALSLPSSLYVANKAEVR